MDQSRDKTYKKPTRANNADKKVVIRNPCLLIIGMIAALAEVKKSRRKPLPYVLAYCSLQHMKCAYLVQATTSALRECRISTR